MTNGKFKRLRIAILGNCQASGLHAAAQRLLPGAEVKGWHIGRHQCSDEELFGYLAGFDTVISQVSDWAGHAPLHIARLREQGVPVVYLPDVAFTGLHPDSVHIYGSNGLVQGPETNLHSVIVAASFTLGLPERRVFE